MKKLRWWLLILAVSLALGAFGPAKVSRAAGDVMPTSSCDLEEFTRLEADFQRMTEIRAHQPSVFSTEEYKAAALAYLASGETCLHTMSQANLQTETDPITIDEGGLSPYAGVLGPLFNTNSLKWGANSPYNPSGQNIGGPGTPGGTVTYSYMPAGVSHVGSPTDNGGTNTDVRTIASVSSCVQTEIAAAFAAWSAVANIQFVEVSDSGLASNAPGATGNIRIGAHAFDGVFNVLAHAYFPPSTGDTFNSIAGDLHFDVAEPWSCSPASGKIDIGLVALHEIGHSIGLNHEPANGNLAVMNPTYNPALSVLQQDDINGVVSIYSASGLGGNADFPCIPLFEDDHEDGFADWTTSNGSGSNSWQGLSDGNGYKGSTNSWFVADIGSVSDSYLTSQSIAVTQAKPTLNFFHSYSLEDGYDGGIVEIKINGGAFSEVSSAKFIKNGYDQVISVDFSSPIGGHPAFTGESGGYLESVVDLSDLVSQGDTLQVRFHQANDNGDNATGWRVDDVKVCTNLKAYLPIVRKNN
ncbi:MAG: matrixin family metalloprotease [Anaerolineae bacterium]